MPLSQIKRLLKSILPAPATSWLGRTVHQARAFFLRTFFNDYSQSGETNAVRRFLKGCKDKTFVEVGANDGITVSVTYGLVRDGWSGVSVEANPKVFQRLRQNLERFPKVRTLCCAAAPRKQRYKLYMGKDDPEGLLSTISTDNSEYFREVRDDSNWVEVDGLPLTEILESNSIGNAFALLVVDAEGLDFEILQTLDFARYRPRLIVTEDYAPTNEAKFRFLRDSGYAFRTRVGCNTFWLDARTD